jgi:hypothetical protein
MYRTSVHMYKLLSTYVQNISTDVFVYKISSTYVQNIRTHVLVYKMSSVKHNSASPLDDTESDIR